MNRGARLLIRLYPSWWRARYGEEFLALPADHRLSIRCVRNAPDPVEHVDEFARLAQRRSSRSSAAYSAQPAHGRAHSSGLERIPEGRGRGR